MEKIGSEVVNIPGTTRDYRELQGLLGITRMLKTTKVWEGASELGIVSGSVREYSRLLGGY